MANYPVLEMWYCTVHDSLDTKPCWCQRSFHETFNFTIANYNPYQIPICPKCNVSKFVCKCYPTPDPNAGKFDQSDLEETPKLIDLEVTPLDPTIYSRPITKDDRVRDRLVPQSNSDNICYLCADKHKSTVKAVSGMYVCMDCAFQHLAE